MSRQDDSIDKTLEIMLSNCLAFAEFGAWPKQIDDDARERLCDDDHFGGSFSRELRSRSDAYANKRIRHFLHKWSWRLGSLAKDFSSDENTVCWEDVDNAIAEVRDNACEPPEGTWCDFDRGEN
ncbi:hypothetical protein ABI59_15290 [Acidobacteria bacterium Mor1]|nr:hypothetical protein ABI59_15290 [Acidobacteria bacterium Mor1]